MFQPSLTAYVSVRLHWLHGDGALGRKLAGEAQELPASRGNGRSLSVFAISYGLQSGKARKWESKCGFIPT